jgi:uncharacterized membrane protein
MPKDTSPPKDSGNLVQSEKVGYVQHVDSGALTTIADDIAMDIFVSAIPGTLVGPGRTVAWTDKVIDDEVRGKILGCFAINDTRSFDQDPRFGASVLTEIASRALSSAVNDPGTAIDVLSRTLRVLVAWRDTAARQEGKAPYPALHVTSIDASDLFDDLYTPVARDGAGIVQVGLRLQKTLALTADLGAEYRRHAKRHSQEALDRADKALHIDVDRKWLKDASLLAK